MDKVLARFVDEAGKIKQLPTKQSSKNLVLAYLAAQFALDAEYTEKEINAIIGAWHTFGDYFLLRRELVDNGWLGRLPDGSRYWRIAREDSQPEL